MDKLFKVVAILVTTQILGTNLRSITEMQLLAPINELSRSSQRDQKLEEVKAFLGITNLQLRDDKILGGWDIPLEAVVQLSNDLILLRGGYQDGLGTLGLTAGYKPSYPRGIYSRASFSGIEKNTTRSPLENSRSVMEEYSKEYHFFDALVHGSTGGLMREKKGDVFISFTRSIDTALKFTQRSSSSVTYIVKIPMGQYVIDLSYAGEEIILIPHFVPIKWVIAVIITDEETYRSINKLLIRNVEELKEWEVRLFFVETLNQKTIGRILRRLGLDDANLVPHVEDPQKPMGTNLKGETVPAVEIQIPAVFAKPNHYSARIYVFQNQTLRQAIKGYPLFHYLFSKEPNRWRFYHKRKNGSVEEINLDAHLSDIEGNTVYLQERSSVTQPDFSIVLEAAI